MYFSLIEILPFNKMIMIVGFLVSYPPFISTTEDLPYGQHNQSTEIQCDQPSFLELCFLEQK